MGPLLNSSHPKVAEKTLKENWKEVVDEPSILSWSLVRLVCNFILGELMLVFPATTEGQDIVSSHPNSFPLDLLGRVLRYANVNTDRFSKVLSTITKSDELEALKCFKLPKKLSKARDEAFKALLEYQQ